MRMAALALKRKQWEPFAFASPSLILILIVIVFPLAYSFLLSLKDFDLSVGPEAPWVGLKNYSEALLHDERFRASILTTIVIIVPALVAELLLGLGIALLLNRPIRARPILTALLAIPPMVSPVMAGTAWPMSVAWGEKLEEMKALGIEYHPDWAAKSEVAGERWGAWGAPGAPHLDQGQKVGPQLPQPIMEFSSTSVTDTLVSEMFCFRTSPWYCSNAISLPTYAHRQPLGSA